MSENVLTLFKNFEAVGNGAKEAIKARVTDVRIMWVSNSNWIPVIGHLRDRAPIT